jgi:hypothetical protein
MAKLINCECGYVARGADDKRFGKYERSQLLDMIEETGTEGLET